MARYLIRPKLTFVEQEDGSWIAMGRELPIFIAAPSREELERRLDALTPALNAFLEKVGDPDNALAYIKERGIPFEPIGDVENEGRTKEFPIAVSV